MPSAFRKRRISPSPQHNCERLFSHFSSRGDTSTGGGATAFLFERSSPSVVVLPPRVQISCCGTCTRTGCMFAARQSRRKRCQSPTTRRGEPRRRRSPGEKAPTASVTDVWISAEDLDVSRRRKLVDDGAVLSLWCISVLISGYLVSQYLISYLSAHGVRGVSVE